MNVLLAMLAGVCGAMAAGFAGFMGASAYAAATHMTSMEGASGYFALAIAVLCALAGLVGGIVGALLWRGVGLAGLVTRTAAAIGGLVALSALGFGAYYAMQPHYLGQNGPTPLLKFEIMAAPNAPLPDYEALSIELQTDENGNDGVWNRDVRESVDGKPVRAGYVYLHFRTSQRMLVLKLPDGSVQIFKVGLPADPTGKKFQQWSEWKNADFTDRPGQQSQPSPASADKAYRIRYQVETYD